MSDPLAHFDRRSTAADVLANVDVADKVVVMTGCNAGIGLAAMTALNERGAVVYALCRRLSSAIGARAHMKHPELVIPLECDLSELSSVEACAASITKDGRPIDALICNAGVYFLPTLSLIDGVERHFMINHLGHFLLVDRLLPQVAVAPQGRVVIVGSEIHAQAGALRAEGFLGGGVYHPLHAYAQSKLANGLHGIELARRTLGTTTTVNVASPMWVMTETMREHLRRSSPRDLANREIKTPEQGAATICYVATAPELSLVSGRYFEDCRAVAPAPTMLDASAAAWLWNLSVELIHARLASRRASTPPA